MPSLPPRRRISLILAFALTGVSCGPLNGDIDDAEGSPVEEDAAFLDEGLSAADQATADVASVVFELNEFWSDAAAELGFDYQVVALDRVTNGRDGVTCDSRAIERAELEDNAFVDSGCAEGITVAYDPVYIAASSVRLEMTLAHEWGHVVQAQAEGLDLSIDAGGLPIDAELQADCFAGAWAAARSQHDRATLAEEVAEAGDPHGTDVDDPEAHGTAEERVMAFEVGFDTGASGCVTDLVDVLP